MLLHATDLHATYTVVAPLRLPHHTGSLLRGLLGRALRRTACPREAGPCPAACERTGQCTYARLFDPAVPSPSPHRFLKAGAEAPPRLLPLLPAPQSSALETEGRTLSALEAIADLPIGTDAGRVTLAGVARQGRAEPGDHHHGARGDGARHDPGARLSAVALPISRGNKW